MAPAAPTVALSLLQPWATLIALGVKRIETRSWRTRRRGPFAVHASRRVPRENVRLCLTDPIRSILAGAGYSRPEDLPTGAIVGAAVLIDCTVVTPEYPVPDLERAVDHFAVGRWAWRLETPRMLPAPVPARGALGFWPMPPDVARQVAEALAA